MAAKNGAEKNIFMRMMDKMRSWLNKMMGKEK